MQKEERDKLLSICENPQAPCCEKLCIYGSFVYLFSTLQTIPFIMPHAKFQQQEHTESTT